MTTKEASKLLNRSANRVTYYCMTGVLKAKKVKEGVKCSRWDIPQEEIDRFLKGRIDYKAVRHANGTRGMLPKCENPAEYQEICERSVRNLL